MKILSDASAKKKTKRLKGFKSRTFIGRFQVTSWQRRRYGFQISHFHWSFSNGIRAVNGFNKAYTDTSSVNRRLSVGCPCTPVLTTKCNSGGRRPTDAQTGETAHRHCVSSVQPLKITRSPQPVNPKLGGPCSKRLRCRRNQVALATEFYFNSFGRVCML